MFIALYYRKHQTLWSNKLEDAVAKRSSKVNEQRLKVYLRDEFERLATITSLTDL